LLLLLVVLAPSVCLLWFMRQAVQNERLAVRQKLTEAYQGYLSLARDRLEVSWQQAADDVEKQAEDLTAPAVFARQVRDGRADAVIVFDASGNLAYPEAVVPLVSAEPVGDWAAAQQLELRDPAAAAGLYAGIASRTTNVNQAALALQSQARCLIQAGSNAAAVTVLTGPLARDEYRDATDPQGRLLIPNAQLVALDLLKDSASDRMPVLRDKLQAQLLDYDTTVMPAAQRRFLMREFQRLFPSEPVAFLLAAEDLAARHLEAGVDAVRKPGLSLSPLPGVWQMSVANGRVVTLHRTETLVARMQAAASSPGLPDTVQIDVVRPGQEAEGALLSLPAGPVLPGWSFALSLRDPLLLEAATQDRVATYVWTGVLVVATVVVLAVLALGLVRRQAALTQLRNDLVANVTHELKTPLSSMRLLVDTLLNSPQLHEQTAREYLELIAKENLRLSRLIDNFLMFSRIERNKYTFDFHDVPATTIVEAAASAVRQRFDVPECRFSVQVAPHLPSVVADADAMVTALVNLLDNAWKYSGDEKQITLAAEARDGVVSFSVRDNGVGLSPQDTKRIFGRFYRVDRHLSQPSAGCGLGLSIVQFIVTAHEGTVGVESEPDRGSTFTVTLPAKDVAQPRETKA
jgi:signal transduction histidine kinase